MAKIMLPKISWQQKQEIKRKINWGKGMRSENTLKTWFNCAHGMQHRQPLKSSKCMFCWILVLLTTSSLHRVDIVMAIILVGKLHGLLEWNYIIFETRSNFKHIHINAMYRSKNLLLCLLSIILLVVINFLFFGKGKKTTWEVASYRSYLWMINMHFSTWLLILILLWPATVMI